MLPYGRQSIAEDDVEAVTEVLRGDWLTTGPAVDPFEAELARWTGGVPCVAVTSGTAALHVAYVAAGVGPGDEVVTSPLTFVATAATAALRGRPGGLRRRPARHRQPRPGRRRRRW